MGGGPSNFTFYFLIFILDFCAAAPVPAAEAAAQSQKTSAKGSSAIGGTVLSPNAAAAGNIRPPPRSSRTGNKRKNFLFEINSGESFSVCLAPSAAEGQAAGGASFTNFC